VEQILADDPTNPSGMYLRGLMNYRRDQYVDARKAFESVLTQVPNHAPTLNNLGVVMIRTNAVAASLNYLDQAMIAAPRNRQVLDNVAEVLNSLSDEQLNLPVAQRVARKFAEQDEELSRQMAKDGLHRWGS